LQALQPDKKGLSHEAPQKKPGYPKKG